MRKPTRPRVPRRRMRREAPRASGRNTPLVADGQSNPARERIAQYVAILQRWASAEESSDVADHENDDPTDKDR